MTNSSTAATVTDSEASGRLLPRGIGLLLAVQGVALLVGAIAHTGVELSLGVAVIAEPRIVPAIIVEGVCGFLLVGSAYAALSGRPWAWTAALASQTVALGGVLLGITALAVGAGPETATNAAFHRVMVVLLVGGLVLVLTPTARRAFRAGD